VYTAITPPCIRRAREVYTAVTRVDGRCAAAYGSCTRPVNTSSPAKTARTRPCRIHGPYTAVYGLYGPCTRPVYTTRVHDCVRAVFGRVNGAYTAPYTGHVHDRVRAVHTTVYTTRIRPRTCVYVCTAVYGPSTRPKTAVHGRVTCSVYGRVRAVSARVQGSVQSVCTAVFGRVHWPCTLPFSAVYIARRRPCNGPCTRPCTRASGPCIRQVGLPGSVHVPRRHATAVCGPLRHTVGVRRRVHGPCRRTCTRLCMGRVHDRVHGALRPCTRPTAVTCRLGPCRPASN